VVASISAQKDVHVPGALGLLGLHHGGGGSTSSFAKR